MPERICAERVRLYRLWDEAVIELANHMTQLKNPTSLPRAEFDRLLPYVIK